MSTTALHSVWGNIDYGLKRPAIHDRSLPVYSRRVTGGQEVVRRKIRPTPIPVQYPLTPEHELLCGVASYLMVMQTSDLIEGRIRKHHAGLCL